VSHALSHDHALLCAAVRAAGPVATHHFEAGFEVREKAPGDPVTDADMAVDASLRDALCVPRPDYGWLSEESAEHATRQAAPRTWVVDPIDGTKGFIEGNHEWVISAALVEAGAPIAAAILNPVTGDFYDAVLGGGCRLNGEAAQCTTVATLAEATLGSSRNEQRRALWSDHVGDAAIKVVDAIAYKLALVAVGQIDGTVAMRPKSDWDIAAGHLLITEAGGTMSDADGNALIYNRDEIRHPNLMASGMALYPVLRSALAKR
jgi:myo-inositol-1(or 4)-monophosphatase